MTTRELIERCAAVRTEMRALHAAAPGRVLEGDDQAKFDSLSGELDTLNGTLEREARRSAVIDDMDRRANGQPITATGDQHLDRMVDSVGVMDVMRAQMGATDAAAGRAREASQELSRRSGRQAQGLFWNMGAAERRTLTSGQQGTAPTGAALVPTDLRPDLFIDRLRNATRVRALGATVLAGLSGNVTIPRRTQSVTAAWVAENTAIPPSDQAFDAVTLTPKHAGALTDYSRNMLMQASPDIEALTRNDMARTLAEALDGAAIAGSGSGAQPRGILNQPGIGTVSMGANGGALTYAAVADLVGQVDDANADGSGTGFLMSSRVRRAAVKLTTTQGEPLGLDVVFQGKPMAVSNLVPGTGTKGTGSNLSSLVYGAWSDLMIGLWSELDILVNPYAAGSYEKGNVSIRAMMTCDVAVRHPASFAAISDLTT
jgi:HK97 family phage major capsid protein